jgi:glycerate kinase
MQRQSWRARLHQQFQSLVRRTGAPDTPVVVCAPNAFKGTLDAGSAASFMARGVRDAGATAIEVPVADGGDGTLDVLLSAARRSTSASRTRVERHRVTGPLRTRVVARLGWLDARTAVVEMAEAAGLRLIPPGQLDALHATSRGAGELIRVALDADATRVIVGVGGSATTDGGAGLLQALGARLLDATGSEIEDGGEGLLELARIDLSSVHPGLRDCVVDVATDVRSPLLGSEGAAAVFAPQKGADPEQVRRLEAALTRLAEVAAREGAHVSPETPGTGAAGGCGFALALLGARLLPGAPLVCDLLGLDAALAGADAAITGEGRLDAQTASGKAPAEVALRARQRRIPSAVVAGQVVEAPRDLFDIVISLESLAGEGNSRRHVRALLRRAARFATLDALGRRPQ